MTSAAAPAATTPEVVQLDGGPVTLAPLEQVKVQRDSLDAEAKDLESQVAQLRQDATVKARDAATYLVAQRSKWDASAVSDQLARLDSLTAQIDEIDSQLAELAAVRRRGFGGFFKRFSDRNLRTTLMKRREQAIAEVNSALAYVGEHAPATTFPDADALLEPARQEATKADALQRQSADIAASISALGDQIKRRQDAVKKLGFDALWTAAWLRDHAPETIDSPLTLKKGEVAWLSVNAVLSRQATRMQWTGSSQGVSFPIGHTGIRYRVGSYRGHPIQTAYIKDLDSGTLVLTNQRLVFVGRMKSVTIALSHVIHVEAYSDALGVFQDKRETPDFFKLQTPQYVLFYINYAMSRLT